VPGQATPPSDWNPGQQDDANRSGGWNTPAPTPQQDDPARSGGWNTAAPAAQQADQSEPNPWPAPGEPGQPEGWGAAASVPQRQDERPEVPDWAAAEPTSVPPARATASVGTDGPQSWGAAPAESANPQQWPGTDRPADRAAAPDVQPWAPGEAWGRNEAESAGPQSAGNGWEPERSEDRPLYQPAPGPGISPANAVPLPPQEQRVPGASLAAAPPADYAPPAPFAPAEPPAPSGRDGIGSPYDPEPAGAEAGWGRAEEPQSQGHPFVPAPRVSPESGPAARAAVPQPEAGEAAAGAVGSVSASASVPTGSRVTPPADQAAPSGGTPAPRVYGRPARPEPADEPEQVAETGFRPDHNPPPRFDEQNPHGRFDDLGPQRFDDPTAQGRFDEPNAPGRFGEPGPPARFDDPGMQGRFDERGPQGRFDEPTAQGRFDGPGPQGRFEDSGPQRFDDPDRAPGQQRGFGDGPAAGAAVGAPPAFPPGVPSFVDPPANKRPVNGVRPHDDDRQGEQFPGPGAAAQGPGAGPAPYGEPGQGGFPPAYQAPGQQPGPSWGQEPAQDQDRFNAFKPDAAEEPKTEAPTPKVRNGRVLAAVLVAAVLILAVPLGLLMLLGKVGGGSETPFDPAVGSCVKQAGDSAAAATCGEAGTFSVVSKVDAKEKCADPAQPYVVLKGDVPNKVLCLKPSTK
jgi:hypothetical protein